MEVQRHSFYIRQGFGRIFIFAPCSLYPLVSTSLFCVIRILCGPLNLSGPFSEDLKY